MTVKVVAISGATGYLGTVLEPAFVAAGYRVQRLTRSPRLGTDDRAFSLGQDVRAELFDGVDVFVHCAYDMMVTARPEIWERNVFGTVKVFDAAMAAGVGRTVAVSSMSAYPGTRQLYGRAKLEVELAALDRGMAVVRPGLVYGPGWGGMAGTLRRMATLPVLPDFGAGAVQFTIHEDDLASAVVAIAQSAQAPGAPVGIAHPKPLSFRTLIGDLAAGQGRPRPRFIPVPSMAVYGALRIAEALGVPLPVRADSLLGLVRPAPVVANVASAVRSRGRSAPIRGFCGIRGSGAEDHRVGHGPSRST